MRLSWKDGQLYPSALGGFVAMFGVVLALMAANAAATQAFTVSGTVTAQGSGQGVPNVEVLVTESGTSNEVALPTTTAANGSYSVSVPAGTYDVTFTPPTGSEFGSLTDRDEVVSGNTKVDVLLVPAGSATFSGVLFGEGGVPLAGTEVHVGNESLRTNSSGEFSGTFAPGKYSFFLEGGRGNEVSHAAAPSSFYFQGSIDLTSSINENLTLPVHALTVRTVGPNGDPIPGVTFTEVADGSINATLAPGIQVGYAQVYENETTNANGNTTLSVPDFLNETRLEAKPPAETQLPRTPFNIEQITEDQTREIKLIEGVTFAGVLFGEGGVPLAGTEVHVGNESLRTNSSGEFSGTFAPGKYSFFLEGGRGNEVSHAAAPSSFYFQGSIDLTSSINENLTLPVHALTVRTVGPNGDPIPGVTFTEVADGSINATLAPGIQVGYAQVYENETTNANGNTTLSVPDFLNETRLEAKPPAETQLPRTPFNIEQITEDQTREIKLIEGVTFAGVLFGEGGVPLAGTEVHVGNESLRTNSSGEFSGTFAPGKYSFFLEGGRGNEVSHAAAPSSFYFQGSIDLTSSINENLTLPVHALTVRTVGPNGDPIPGVTFTEVADGSINATLAPGIQVGYAQVYENETTNANGNTTLSVPDFLNETRLEAKPPAETQLPRTPFNIEQITEDQTRLIAFAKSGTDVTPPEIKCASAPSGWQAENVTLACTASDSDSGLANPEDASFSLSTSIAAGEETAASYTNSVRVCDKADNCAQAGPVGPIEIDRKAPSISITAPASGAKAQQGSSVNAEYTCADGGSGVATCEGTVASGTALDTSTLGEHTLTVTSIDTVGNHSSKSVTYDVITEDTTPPMIAITAPEDGEIVDKGTKLSASYTCSDSGSGVASCEGSVPSGSSLETSTPGEHTLSAAASDRAGNTASRTVHYTVVEPSGCGETAQLCETGLGDETPPNVTGLSVSPSTVDTATSAKSVSVDVHATDNLSGVSAIQVNLSNGSRWISAPAALASGTRLHGTWDATLVLPEGSAEGSYALSISTIDNVGNYRKYSADELESLGFPSTITETGVGVTTPPQLSAVTATPASLSTCSAPQSTTIGVRASDNSGVAYVTAYLTGPDGQSRSTPATLDSGSATSGHWSASLTLPEHAQQGTWSISIQTGDEAGNSAYISSAQLATDGYTSTVEQTCPGDTSPPQVTGVTLAPETLDTSGGPRNVVVDVHATDNLSGVASLQATLSSGGQSQTASASLQSGGTTLTGIWQATITLPRWSRQGTWLLSLTATDAVGNSVSLSPTQIEALGLPHSIDQSGEGDETPPTANKGSISPSSFDTSQHPVTVGVSVHAADAQSGTALVRIEFTSPNGTQHVYGEATRTEGNPQEGVWTATLEFPQYSQQGSWTPRLELWDAFGNHRAYTGTELAAIFPPIGVAEKKPPTITKLSAKKGPATGGTPVTITGTEFLGVSAVRFGANNATSFTVNGPTSIAAVAPPGTSGKVDVFVTTPYGTSVETSKAAFKYASPTVTEVAPDSGLLTGGTAVAIHGSGFATGAGNTIFAFGSVNATSVECSSTANCTAIAPAAEKAGTVDVLAKVGKVKSKKAPPGDQYTYH